MKRPGNAQSSPVFLITITFLQFVSLFTQPLAVKALPGNITANYHISQNNQKLKKISQNRLVIGGISLSMSEDQVKKILGKPLKIKNSYEAIAGKTRILQYSGITVKSLENVQQTGKFSVYEIEVNSSKYATLDKVKVGDSFAKVIKTYGQPESGGENSNNTNLMYAVASSSPIYFNFAIQNGKVKSILCGDFLG
jgi:hypothetical protein